MKVLRRFVYKGKDDVQMYECSLDRMKDKISTFSKFGDADHGGITRYSLSPEAIMARNEFIKRMKAIGAEIEIDDVANIYATLAGTDPDAKRIVMASHCDSVKNGGNYDGILGVMSAMEVLETVHEKNIPHKHPLTAMIWTNEEGSLYPPAMMCSGIVCYDYLPEDIRCKFKYEDMMNSKSTLTIHRHSVKHLTSRASRATRSTACHPTDICICLKLTSSKVLFLKMQEMI